MKLDDFFKGKIVKYIPGTYTTYMEGLTLFIEHAKDVDGGITYNFMNSFSLNGIDVLKIDNSGKYYYDFIPEKYGDIIDHIIYESSDINATLSYMIGNDIVQPEEFNEFIFISAQYTEFKIRITFIAKPNKDDRFHIYNRYWLLNNEARLLLMKQRIITKFNIYENGICKKLKQDNMISINIF